MIRNYFADLELEHTSSLQEVRAAFRRLAKQFHPDVQPQDPLAAESFRRIHEAYEHLNTVTKITRLKGRLSQVEALENSSITKWKIRRDEGFDIETLPGIKKLKKKEMLDIHLQLGIQQRVFERGGKERFQFVFDKPCPKCRGKGGTKKSVALTCKKCAGVGTSLISRGAMKWKKTCEGCFGKGVQVIDPCFQCSGKGKVSERQAVEIQIPKDMDLTQEICLHNLGHISFDGTRRGDLWLLLSFKE